MPALLAVAPGAYERAASTVSKQAAMIVSKQAAMIMETRMPKKDEEKAIRKIQKEYGVSAERARAIYFGHKANLARKGPAARLRAHTAKLSHSRRK